MIDNGVKRGLLRCRHKLQIPSLGCINARSSSLAGWLGVGVATAAAAQTGETGLAKCERPAAPFVPSGGYANAQAMQEAGVELKAYFDGINAYLRCGRGEYTRARAEAEQIQLQWQDARDRFQSR